MAYINGTVVQRKGTGAVRQDHPKTDASIRRISVRVEIVEGATHTQRAWATVRPGGGPWASSDAGLQMLDGALPVLRDHPPDGEDARTTIAAGAGGVAHLREASRTGSHGLGHQPVTHDRALAVDHGTLLMLM